jgi:hypothetical protein
MEETAVLPFTLKKKRYYREDYIIDNMFTPSFNRAKPSIITILKLLRGITTFIFSNIKEATNINKEGKSLTKNKIIS